MNSSVGFLKRKQRAAWQDEIVTNVPGVFICRYRTHCTCSGKNSPCAGPDQMAAGFQTAEPFYLEVLSLFRSILPEIRGYFNLVGGVICAHIKPNVQAAMLHILTVKSYYEKFKCRQFLYILK